MRMRASVKSEGATTVREDMVGVGVKGRIRVRPYVCVCVCVCVR